MSQKLANATALYMEGIRDGHARQAVEAYTGDRYTQHSTGVRDGVEGFVEFFEPFVERNPVRDIRVIRSIVDGRYVFLHAFQSLNDGEAEWVTTDFFGSLCWLYFQSGPTQAESSPPLYRPRGPRSGQVPGVRLGVPPATIPMGWRLQALDGSERGGSSREEGVAVKAASLRMWTPA
jgi:predicted SnoaL-like aldol condensation-catalyzing enzyme